MITKSGRPTAPVAPAAARLSPGDLARLATVGLRTRKLRAGLSALGIAIGVAAITAVLGQPGHLCPGDRLGGPCRLPRAAQKYLNFDGHPSQIYVRTIPNDQAATTTVDSLLGPQANPENPGQVTVSQPSDALTAQADAEGALDTLFPGLGAVALLVGAIGVANIMVISVLERRPEIGLRRALGATRGQIRAQFLAEAILLSLAGGAAGVAIGAVATAA